MKVLIIHSKYSKIGGEEKVVETQKRLLSDLGVDIITYIRDYHEQDNWRFAKLKAFFCSIHSNSAIRDIKQIIRNNKPDAVIIHNLFPIISPSIITEIKNHGIPVVMTMHNYRLFCPIGLFYNKGNNCTECATSALREFRCIINNCEGTFAGSCAFAIRNLWNRHKQYYNLVDKYLSVSEFQKNNLVKFGLNADKITIIPNCTEVIDTKSYKVLNRKNIVYVGRISEEKGIDIFIDIAKKLPEYTFKIAGDKSAGFTMPNLPNNVELCGFLSGDSLVDFYHNAKIIVFTSKVWEAMPLTVIEAMANGVVTVSKRVSSLPEILDYGTAGILFDTSNEAVRIIRNLMADEDQYNILSHNAIAKVGNEYSPQKYANSLKLILESLVSISQ